jgi:hemerythrin-like domain-containing protein
MKSTELLKAEHVVIEKALDTLQLAVERINSGQPIPDGFQVWAVEFFRTFADRCHHAKEEDCLFPVMQRRGILCEGGPIGVMLDEHTLARDCVRKMEYASVQQPPDDAAFAAAATQYVALLRQHIYKENDILFHMAEQCLTDEDDAQLMMAFHQAECGKGGHELHDRFEADLARWQCDLSEQSAESLA